MSISTILDFIKRKIITVLVIINIIILLLSILLNIYFVLGGSLKIDKSINTVNLQGQTQSTVIINGDPYSSEKIQWIKITTPINKLSTILESLTGFQVWNIKIIKESIFNNDIVIFYPEIIKEKN